jgi:GWxTD domain-containing protein
MKQFVLLSLSLFALSAFNSKAQGLQAELDMARFDSPELGTYLDTYLKLKGNSLKLEKSANGLRSRVHLTYLVTENKDTAFYDSFILDGPVLGSDSIRKDFIDAQRIKLDKGNYNLKISLADVNSTEPVTRTVEQAVAIRPSRSNFKERMKEVSNPIGGTEKGNQTPTQESIFGTPVDYYFSDVILVDGIKKSSSPGILSKSGMDLVPLVSNFYPPERKELSFYCEVYNTVLQSEINIKNFSNLFKDRTNAHKFLIVTSIQDPELDKVIGNYASRQIVDSSAVIPVLQSFDISELESGNYNLVFELRNFKNDLIDRREVLFQRVNSMSKPDDDYLSSESELSPEDQLDLTFVGKYNRLEMLEEYLRCLHPISSQDEIYQVNRRMNFNDLNMMKKFLYYFWKTRNPEDPEGAWLAYWKEVEKVNASYSTNHKKGYDTDRGRVYLQYGAPNTISPNYFEPNTYPYEIWHYYRLNDHLSAEQSNRKFVFANLEQGTKEFDLIHSDAKNEVTNRRWHHDLHSRSSMSIDLDQENGDQHYGGRSQDFFENPY